MSDNKFQNTRNLNKLVPGVNDIATLLPDVARLFKDQSLPSQRTRGSKDITTFVCPHCGAEVQKRIDAVCAAHGVSCPCSDTWSYPNKFIYALLKQLNIFHEPEKIFSWSDSRKYDEYVECNGKSIIIEMHGEQHYSHPNGNRGRSLQEEQDNDAYKRKLAHDNGIKYYYEINARKSDISYIKDSIITSGLLECLGFNSKDIDWIECDKFATSNFCKIICESYNNSKSKDVGQIADQWHLGIRTVRRYLHKGNQFGWCDYDAKSNKLNNLSLHAQVTKKKVFCKTIAQIFDSATDAAKYLNLPDAKNNGRSIRNSIKYHRPYLGYEFEYVV